jgi:hypothetical protein|eukprot:COSAG06_NODE_3634_length_5094_cov_3.280881_3_plen_38_part_00
MIEKRFSSDVDDLVVKSKGVLIAFLGLGVPAPVNNGV